MVPLHSELACCSPSHSRSLAQVGGGFRAAEITSCFSDDRIVQIVDHPEMVVLGFSVLKVSALKAGSVGVTSIGCAGMT